MTQADIAQDPTLSPLVKALYMVLASYANSERECWPSQQTLARNLGVSDRTVRKALKQATTAGLLEVIHTQTSNRYRLRDMRVGGYVLGSGPEIPAGSSVPAELEDEFRPSRSGASDEQDQRTRPATKTTSTSSDAYAAGGPRASSRTRAIELFVKPEQYDHADAGEVARLLTRSSVAALRAHGHEPNADEIGATVTAIIDGSGDNGINRYVLRDQVAAALNLAAGRDPAWQQLIHWPRPRLVPNPWDAPNPFDRRAS